MNPATRLHPGDIVEVKAPEEIAQTLDASGALDHLPVMPEMAEFCGQQFQVFRRVVKTCSSGTSSTMRAFPADDVVLLEGLRCSGAAHDGCQKACMIFWREAWLRKVTASSPVSNTATSDNQTLLTRFRTFTGPNSYFCQASELSPR